MNAGDTTGAAGKLSGPGDEELESWHGDAIARRRDRRTGESRREKHAHRIPLPVKAGIAALALVIAMAGVEIGAAAGRVHPGVYVGDVKIGGMTREAATAKLTAELVPRLAQPVTITHGGRNWEVDSASIEATFEPAPFVDLAFSVGRTGNLAEQIAVRAYAWVRPVIVPVSATCDEAAADAALDLVSAEVRVEPVDATVTVSGLNAEVVSARDGSDIERSSVRAALLTAFVSPLRTIEATVASISADIQDADAQLARADALKMLSGQVVVRFEDKTWEFAPEEISRWIVFTKTGTETTGSLTATGAVPTRKTLVAGIGPEALTGSVRPKLGAAATVVEPVDASFSVSNQKVSIVPHRDGTGPDIEQLAADMTSILTGSGQRVVELRTARVKPAVTTERAKEMGVKERLATYTTSYSPTNKPRVSNIHLLAKALDGALIAPGATFSFNDHAGQRTAEKGYREANAIVNRGGQLVLEPQLGGGICQVGTTMFNTVFFSGLPVVERRNHSFYIDSYPKGRDATISWGGPDFKFQNDTPHWVLIKTAVSASTVTISLYGTDPGYEVEYRTSSFQDIRAHGVIEKKDPTLQVGSRVIEDGGVDGRTVSVTRIVKKAGTVLRTDTFRSVYKPKTEVVRVGTKPASTTTSSPPATRTP